MKDQINNFKIAYKCENIILEISDNLELVPKKFYYEKNKTLSYAYELLETIYLLNSNNSELEKYIPIIEKNIKLIDFQLGFFIRKKCSSNTNFKKATYYLTEISKMTSVWFSNMRKVNDKNRLS